MLKTFYHFSRLKPYRDLRVGQKTKAKTLLLGLSKLKTFKYLKMHDKHFEKI